MGYRRRCSGSLGWGPSCGAFPHQPGVRSPARPGARNTRRQRVGARSVRPRYLGQLAATLRRDVPNVSESVSAPCSQKDSSALGQPMIGQLLEARGKPPPQQPKAVLALATLTGWMGLVAGEYAFPGEAWRPVLAALAGFEFGEVIALVGDGRLPSRLFARLVRIASLGFAVLSAVCAVRTLQIYLATRNPGQLAGLFFLASAATVLACPPMKSRVLGLFNAGLSLASLTVFWLGAQPAGLISALFSLFAALHFLRFVDIIGATPR